MARLIDDDGRLFGIVNVLDLLVVVLVVGLVGTGVALTQTTGSPTRNADRHTTNVTVEVFQSESEHVHPAIASAIPTGSVSNADVVAVHSKTVDPAPVVLPNATGHVRTGTHPRLKTVTLKLELVTNQQAHGPTFRGEPLRIGQREKFTFRTVEFFGTILAVERGQ